MKKLMIDLETRSDVDISKAGVYKYADSPYFEILLFACSVDDGEVVVYDLANGEKIPDAILQALTDDSVEKHAFNANFERVCLSKYLHQNYLHPRSWRCTMISSAYLALPLSLSGVGAALKLDKQKMTEGKTLIRYFCVPYAMENSVPLFRKPSDAPEKWELFKAYNKRDVETEMGIDRLVSRFPVPQSVWDEYVLDQQINDRGILVDMDLVKNAIAFDEKSKAELAEKLRKLTNLDNPNSVMQMKQWLVNNGLEMDSLSKKEVAQAVETAPEELRKVLLLRQQLSKSSVKKYQAMQIATCSDGRARGMFQFYGANRTGREAGRLIQLQNLPQNHLPDLDEARDLVKLGDIEILEMLYEDIPDTLSQLIRTAFIPQPNMKFIVADFSAIEARVIAWLAGEQWRMDAFANGKDIYCESASKMFGVPVEKHGVNGHLRQKGKVAELACGYGGSVGAMKAMGADALGLSDTELKKIVTDWREASPHITALWWDVDRATKKAVKEKCTTETHRLTFSYEKGFLFIRLPSGRRLAYAEPRIGLNKFGSEAVTYMGLSHVKKWERLESYGPKFVENCIQGIARDLLFYAMQTLSDCRIVAHIHDEVVIETPMNTSVEEICERMAQTPQWAGGLVLQADGYACKYYKKD